MVVTTDDKSYLMGTDREFGDFGRTASVCLRSSATARPPSMGFGIFYTGFGNTAGAPTSGFSHPLVQYPVALAHPTFRSAQGFTSPPALPRTGPPSQDAHGDEHELLTHPTRHRIRNAVVEAGYTGPWAATSRGCAVCRTFRSEPAFCPPTPT